MNSTDIIYVKDRSVFCDGREGEGGDPSVGHPAIYLEIKDSEIECPYCGKKFILNGSTTA